MLSCRHASPSRSLPRACSAAITADVPVPHGERSYSPPEQSTKLRASASARVGRPGELDVIDRRAAGDVLLGGSRPESPALSRVSSATLSNVERALTRCVMKNQLPPYATSPVTMPTPATSTRTSSAWHRAGTFSIVTEPSVVRAPPRPRPAGVSKRAAPARQPAQGTANVRTTPMSPWPHIPRYVPLLKKTIPAVRIGSDRRRQQRADDRRMSARLADDGAAQMVEVATQIVAALLHRRRRQARAIRRE